MYRNDPRQATKRAEPASSKALAQHLALLVWRLSPGETRPYSAGGLAVQARWLAALAVCCVFVNKFVTAFTVLAKSPFNVLQSYVLAGCLSFLLPMGSHLTLLRYIEDFSINLKLNRRKT
jgi:hypothetical protein